MEIAKRGHKVKVFTTSKDSSNGLEKYSNLDVHRYGTNLALLSTNISIGRYLGPIKYSLDIIHEHFDVPYGTFASLRYVRKKKVPLVVTYHGDWDENYGHFFRRVGVSIHNKYFVNDLLSNADTIICPSWYYISNSRFLSKYKEKIEIIPNGINLVNYSNVPSKEECRKRLGLPLDKNLLLFLSFLSPYKGPDVLLKAMPYVFRNFSDTELIIVGDGPIRSELESLAKKLDIYRSVRFVGFVGDYEKLLYYNSADMFILPSTRGTDVFPLVLLEASAAGLPIITSNLDTFRCIIEENYNGLFAQQSDENELAKTIMYILDDDKLRERLGKNARNAVKKFSWEKIAKETEDIYNRILS